MKTILRSILIMCFLFPFPWGAVRSQERCMEERRERFHETQLERLSRELELSAEQKQKISDILKKGWEKIRKEMEKMRQRVLAIRRETDSQIEKLLTIEQQEKFKELREKLGRKTLKERWWRTKPPCDEPLPPEPEEPEPEPKE